MSVPMALVKLGAVAGAGYLAVHALAGSAGAGIQGQPARVHCAAGETCPFAVQVTNPGSGTETMTFRVQRLSRGRGITLPRSWVTSRPVRLGAGKSATAHLEVTVPPGAGPGRYFSGVVVYGAPGTLLGVVHNRAAAETKLIIVVHAEPAWRITR